MPNFNPFSSGRSNATLFEIRLERELIVLRGPENEAASHLLKGVVVLCLPQALKVEDVHLRMTGQCKIGWHDSRNNTPHLGSAPRHERIVENFCHRWQPFVGGEGNGSSSKNTTLPAGNYEWPFEVVIPGSTAESVEGLGDVHVVYKLKATVARGRMSYDLHAYKPVRIIRTLDPSALELAHAMTVENVWPNKVEYSIIVPQKAVIFGTSIQVEMAFTPLLKGLKIGTVKCELVESHNWMLNMPISGEHRWKRSRGVVTWRFEMSQEEHYRDMINDSGQDGWVLKETLRLPKSLKRCMQDVEMPGIKIRHKVKFVISLLNPDGHVSELRASLPVTIFISPNMPIDDCGNLVDQTPNNSHSFDVDSHAPPLYGEHILDQLYAGMDQSGFRTPAPQSGISTPSDNQSRPGSQENMPTIGGVGGTEIRPDALSTRLQNLDSSLPTTSSLGSFVRRNNASSSGGNTPLTHGHGSSASMQNYQAQLQSDPTPRSNPLSRRGSEEDHPGSGITSGRVTPEHIDYSEIDLNKVPSYTTAVKQPARSLSYSDAQALPNYETAISAPPSPEFELSTLAEAGGAASPEANGNNGVTSVSRPLIPRSGSGLIFPRADPRTIDTDAGRRFLLMQVRARE